MQTAGRRKPSSLHPVLSLPVYPTICFYFSIINAQTLFFYFYFFIIKPCGQQLSLSQDVNRTQQCVVCL